MLNEKAMNIYQFIKDSIENGYPPTVREICSALDIKSTSTVHKYINLLVEEGYIEKMDNHNRAIRLKGFLQQDRHSVIFCCYENVLHQS